VWQRCDPYADAHTIADPNCRARRDYFDVAQSFPIAYPHAHPPGGPAARPAYAASEDIARRAAAPSPTAARLLLPPDQQRPLLRAR
jgi:hypothetical protein